MSQDDREYTNGEVTVLWQPKKCMHSGICAAGLKEVFNPKLRPWIDLSKATTAQIVATVAECPSGALSLKPEVAEVAPPGVQVEVIPNGPLRVHGVLSVKHSDGTQTQHQQVTAFCRCGASSKKPFCDGTHKKNGFSG